MATTRIVIYEIEKSAFVSNALVPAQEMLALRPASNSASVYAPIFLVIFPLWIFAVYAVREAAVPCFLALVGAHVRF